MMNAKMYAPGAGLIGSMPPMGLEQCSENAATRQPQIQRELDVMEKTFAMHGETLERLVQRLQPVLSPMPPQSEGKENRADSSCPLAAALQRFDRTLNGYTEALRVLLERLEV